MNTLTLLLLSFLLFHYGSCQTDRPCSKNISNLWLDVVVLVDNTHSMTDDGLLRVHDSMRRIFMWSNIGRDPSNPKTTRLGFVQYNKNTTMVADLNYWHTQSDFQNTMAHLSTICAPGDRSNLQLGLATAKTLLDAGRQGVRENYQQVIMIYASTYQDDDGMDPVPMAHQLRAQGIKIITIARRGLLDDPRVGLRKVASPGMAFEMLGSEYILIPIVQDALLNINCYCPTYWTQYTVNGPNGTVVPYGVCVKNSGAIAFWKTAKLGCQSIQVGAHLVTEYSQEKHNFVYNMVKSETGYDQQSYHIGLSGMNGGWYWEQAKNMALVPLGSPNFWIGGEPTPAGGNYGVMNSQIADSDNVGWQIINPFNVWELYVCEMESCDADNYYQLIANGESGTFDFCFIDADKPNYSHYYDRAVTLLRKGGVIFVDNSLWDGNVCHKSKRTDESTIAIHEMNDKIYHDDRTYSALLNLGDGVHVAFKK